MGYSENSCRLCGVSFNIGRIRTPEEPESEGWTCTGDGIHFPQSSLGGDCVPGGCRITIRKKSLTVNSDSRPRRIITTDPDNYDEEEDLDYVVESDDDQDYDRYDFESDDDVVGQEVVDEDVEMGEAFESKSIESERQLEREIMTANLRYLKCGCYWEQDQSSSGQFNINDGRVKEGGAEHLAGPGCSSGVGYNGYLITAEEMKGCNTLQCLKRKDSGWQPASDDQDFELESHYFLTGISDYSPSGDTSFPVVIPARHGLESPCAQNVLYGYIPTEDCAMPFHTACFDIYSRLSRLHFGKVDINGLMSWYVLEGKRKDVRSFPRDPNIRKSASQYWQHIRGLEYLAANPFFIPRLGTILQSAIQEDPIFHVEDGVFPVFKIESAGRSSQTLFDRLPGELRLDLLSYLDSKDIANMRLVARAFRQLPNTLFRQLVQKEMPYLWEAWDDSPSYMWNFISPAAIRAEMSAKEAIDKEASMYRNVIREEIPELYDAWVKAERDIHLTRPDPIEEAQVTALTSMITLPADKTNWYQLYTDITRSWGEMKGLKNRKRIWGEIEEITRRVRKYRDEGQVTD